MITEKKQNNVLEIHIADKTLKSVKNTKFLGVMLDNKLIWKEHFDQVKSKINQNYVLLCKSKKLLNLHGIKMLYYAQIYSHLSYCVVLWGSMLSVEFQHKLQALQNKCVKLLDLTKTTDYSHKKHKILKLDQLIYKARHAHKRLYTVLPKYSKIQVLPGITSCRLVKDNKQAIELNSLLINNMPKDGYEWN